VSEGHGGHDNIHYFRSSDSCKRGILPPTLGKHPLDPGKAFFVVIGFNHDADAPQEWRGSQVGA
jgi:hypothetical protein